jgi:hypothetical protein
LEERHKSMDFIQAMLNGFVLHQATFAANRYSLIETVSYESLQYMREKIERSVRREQLSGGIVNLAGEILG